MQDRPSFWNVFVCVLGFLLFPAPGPAQAQTPDEVCRLPADTGPCDGVCPRFFFNACTGQCEPFTWGCCEGNANNFETLAECEEFCPPQGDICFLPAEVGPCEGLCSRFFFNACSGQCESFIWGCCEGNANNFETLEQCDGVCPAGAIESIPAISTWGLVLTGMSLITAGALVLARRRSGEQWTIR